MRGAGRHGFSRACSRWERRSGRRASSRQKRVYSFAPELGEADNDALALPLISDGDLAERGRVARRVDDLRGRRSPSEEIDDVVPGPGRVGHADIDEAETDAVSDGEEPVVSVCVTDEEVVRE